MLPPDPTESIMRAHRERRSPRLIRAEDFYGAGMFLSASSPPPLAEWAWRLYPPVFVDREAPDLSRRGQLDADAVTVARVQEGRWLAECPFCPSAQIVSPLDPRYLCAGIDGCANAPIRGAFARVLFPEVSAQAEIEAALLERAAPINRNWLPRESPVDLHAENARHGVGRPA